MVRMVLRPSGGDRGEVFGPRCDFPAPEGESSGVNGRNQPQDGTFVSLVGQHEGILHKVARAYCPREAQRADLVQEMIVAMWRSFDRYDASRKFSTWMYRIALNVAISFYRSEERRALPLAPLDGAPEKHVDVPEDPRVALLMECIDELGPLNKALVLMHLDGYDYGEIASVLGITTTNTATKLGRIKERLRAAISAETKEEGTAHGTR